MPMSFAKGLDALVGLHAPCAGLDDDDELIHHARRAAAEVLETCLHVHDDHIVLAEDEVGQNRLEHHVLGADAAGSAGIDRTHDEKLDAVDILGELSGRSETSGLSL